MFVCILHNPEIKFKNGKFYSLFAICVERVNYPLEIIDHKDANVKYYNENEARIFIPMQDDKFICNIAIKNICILDKTINVKSHIFVPKVQFYVVQCKNPKIYIITKQKVVIFDKKGDRYNAGQVCRKETFCIYFPKLSLEPVMLVSKSKYVCWIDEFHPKN